MVQQTNELFLLHGKRLGYANIGPEMMERIAGPDFDGKAYDAAYPERLQQTIY